MMEFSSKLCIICGLLLADFVFICDYPLPASVNETLKLIFKALFHLCYFCTLRNKIAKIIHVTYHIIH